MHEYIAKALLVLNVVGIVHLRDVVHGVGFTLAGGVAGKALVLSTFVGQSVVVSVF